eukprot:TRINITY_DN18189_c0_g1_i3.p1 TRINITY_DN18189_c0_g1~~TRINITY_DN18189_c0_g1_i3.p1  ORF type:complete len:245 (+),score=20.41 TRINITY_DN18189_c0_g1_i3:212-946(+)
MMRITLIGCGGDAGPVLAAWTEPGVPVSLNLPTKRTLSVLDDMVTVQMTDITELERYGSNIPACYRRANGILLVLDLFEEDSFEFLQSRMTHVTRYASALAQVLILVLSGPDQAEGSPDLRTDRMLEQIRLYSIEHHALMCELNGFSATEVNKAVDVLVAEMAIASRFNKDNSHRYDISRITWVLCRRSVQQRGRHSGSLGGRRGSSAWLRTALLPEDLFSRILLLAFPRDLSLIHISEPTRPY